MLTRTRKQERYVLRFLLAHVITVFNRLINITVTEGNDRETLTFHPHRDTVKSIIFLK